MVDIVVGSDMLDYILTVCVVWLIMLGFFILLTLAVTLLIGVFSSFDYSTIKKSRNRNRSKIIGG
jgi:hypothetical protein